MASVVEYELEDKAVRWRVRYRDANHKSASKSGFLTEHAAIAFAAELTTGRASRGSPNRSAAFRLAGPYIQQYVSRQSGLSPSTTAVRKSVAKNHVLPKWGDVALSKITNRRVVDWVQSMARRGVGPEVLTKAHGVLLASLAIALGDGAIMSNPASGVKVPRATKTRNLYLTHQEVIELADAVDARSRTLVGLLCYSGLRFDELAALRVGKVNISTRSLTVDRSAATVGGVLVESQLVDKRNREAFFPEVLSDAMQMLVDGKRKTDYVFTAPRGGPVRLDAWRPRVFRSAIGRVNEARTKRAIGQRSTFVEFPNISPHDLRHTAARIAVSSGASVKVLQRMLGHSTVSMTLSRYGDLFDIDRRAVVDEINAQIIETVGIGTWSVGHS